MKRPWLAALLNAWPLPIGIGYLYLRRWGRFVVALVGLQIVAITVFRIVFGPGEAFNLVSAAVWIAVIVDGYLVAKRINKALQAVPGE